MTVTGLPKQYLIKSGHDFRNLMEFIFIFASDIAKNSINFF